ncbi:MAG: type II secretion system protein GspF [Gammaproteobacteria bacterium]|nr:type II secretion system protein GspF [Gammaproteobacteria bacterium]
MAAFDYTALTPDGTQQRGVIEADSERQARKQLREQKLTPLNVSLGKSRTGMRLPGLRLGGPRLGGEELALFTRLLGTLSASGLPLDDVLTAIARQADSRSVNRVALGIRARILEGQSLAVGMEEFPQIFPEDYRATVGAGERTRHLPMVLQRLAGHVENRDRMNKRLWLAMVYPGVLSVTAVLVVTGLLAYVVPEVVKVFIDMKQELPLLTRGLIALSAFARDYGLALLLALLAAVQGLRWFLQKDKPRFLFHRFLLAVPVLGKLLVSSETARFARMLAIMLGSSVDMLDALGIAAKSVTLSPLQKHLRDVIEEVREGSALSRALVKSSLVPPLLPHLIGSGEASGNLVEMLDTGAESFEFKVQNQLSLLLGLLEPLLILLMGAIVLTIVIAILLPIFEMNQLV